MRPRLRFLAFLWALVVGAVFYGLTTTPPTRAPAATPVQIAHCGPTCTG